MRTSEQLNELASALAKAQGLIEAAPKDKDNPFFKSRYADLSSIWNACRTSLSKNGLTVSQGFEPSGSEAVRISTRLMHTSGQWMESVLDLMPKDPSPQAVGSCITYGRRYALAAIVGVVTDEDDDGNQASGHKAALRQPPPEQKPAPKEAAIYDNRLVDHQKVIIAKLDKQKIDGSLYVEIGKRLHGKPFTDLKSVAEAVIAEVSK